MTLESSAGEISFSCDVGLSSLLGVSDSGYLRHENAGATALGSDTEHISLTQTDPRPEFGD